MANKNYHGVERHQEVRPGSDTRDIRTFREKMMDALEKGDIFLMIPAVALGVILFAPKLTEAVLIAGFLFLAWASKQHFSLPFRAPKTGKVKEDWGDLGFDGKPKPSEGIAYFGNEASTGKEIWFNNSDLRTHTLVFGTTGAGKTELLLSLALNSLAHGSGFIFADGKGTAELFAKVFTLCRSMGRDDDVRLLSYLTGRRDTYGPQSDRISNTFNPFSKGSAGEMTEMLVSLMDDAGSDPIWQSRAISLLTSVLAGLSYKRDHANMLLDVDVIRDHVLLENVEKLAADRTLPPQILNSLKNYLKSLPGFVENPPGGKHSETVLEQHGFLQMQFTRVLGTLADRYGYIFRTTMGEIDLTDIVLNRRVLVVLLPSLAVSPAELGNLGKVIVGSLKAMMSSGLGEAVEGAYMDIIESNPMRSPAPYLCILDEWGYYAVKGAEVMPAQARGLGFWMIFASQDYPGLKKNGMAESAVSTIGNCAIKIFMKIEDPTETTELFEKTVGEALVSRASSYSHKSGLFNSGYVDQMSASIERRKRGDFLDLKAQKSGEAHIIFGETLVRAIVFFADPAIKKIKNIKVNSFLRVEPPNLYQVTELNDQIGNVRRLLASPDMLSEEIEYSDLQRNMQTFLEWFGKPLNRNYEETGMLALLAVHKQMKGSAGANLAAFGTPSRPTSVNLFNAGQFGEDDDDESDWDDAEDSLNDVSEALHGQRTGAPNYLKAAADYPKAAPDPSTPEELIANIEELCEGLDDLS